MMKIVKGTVVDGRVEVVGERLEDGQSVTVLVGQGEESFTLPAHQVAELQAALDESARGEVVDGWELLEDLRA